MGRNYHTSPDGSLNDRNREVDRQSLKAKSHPVQRKGLLGAMIMPARGAGSHDPTISPFLHERELFIIKDILESDAWVSQVAEDQAEKLSANVSPNRGTVIGETSTPF